MIHMFIMFQNHFLKEILFYIDYVDFLSKNEFTYLLLHLVSPDQQFNQFIRTTHWSPVGTPLNTQLKVVTPTTSESIRTK